MGQIEVMQHYIKLSFVNNPQYNYATKFFNSEVKHMSLFLLKFKPTINYYMFFYKDFAYLSKKLLN